MLVVKCLGTCDRAVCCGATPRLFTARRIGPSAQVRTARNIVLTITTKKNPGFQYLYRLGLTSTEHCFWFAAEKTRNELNSRGEQLTDFHQVLMFGSFWKFEKSDFEYALGQITARSLSEERSLALSLAFHLYVAGGRDRKQRHKLKKAVTADNTLVEHLSRYLKPPAQDRQHLKNWKRALSDATTHTSENEQNIATIGVHTCRRTPTSCETTNFSLDSYYMSENYLLEFLQETNNRSSRWTDGNWKFLIRHFGNEVARAFRDGGSDSVRNIHQSCDQKGLRQYNPVCSDVGFVWSPDSGRTKLLAGPTT